MGVYEVTFCCSLFCSFHWRRSHGAWRQALTLALRLGLLHCSVVFEVFVLVVRITFCSALETMVDEERTGEGLEV